MGPDLPIVIFVLVIGIGDGSTIQAFYYRRHLSLHWIVWSVQHYSLFMLQLFRFPRNVLSLWLGHWFTGALAMDLAA